jgi:RNA polymerase subunit RPABC4/transcription elongation factor Spt4
LEQERNTRVRGIGTDVRQAVGGVRRDTTMSIRVVCPNGHALKVEDSLAGKTGLCPVCKTRVRVPELRQDELSEDAILSILGPHISDDSEELSAEERPTALGMRRSSTGEKSAPPKKICSKCNQQIDAEIHICPFCHTYIADLSDF